MWTPTCDSACTRPCAPSGRRTAPTYRQHLVTVALASWLMVGLFVDGWAHNNLDASLETFFTPWHALFYSGFTACAVWLLWLVRLGLRRGLVGAAAVPQGYGLGLVGLAVFAVGGVADMTWHLIFGIERDVEALFSPSHLVLFAGTALVLGSPFRDAWAATDRPDPSLRAFVPALASLDPARVAVRVLLHVLVAVHDLVADGRGGRLRDRSGRLLVRDPRVRGQGRCGECRGDDRPARRGRCCWCCGAGRCPSAAPRCCSRCRRVLSSAIDAFDQPAVVLAAPVGGLATDLLVRSLRPSADRRWAVALVAAAGPMVLFSTWFAVLALTRGVSYTTPVWTGMIVWAGLTGLGLVLVALPAPVPVAARRPPARSG